MEYLWAIVWAVLTVILVCVEFATVSLVSIWFAAGALAAAVTALITDLLWVQLLVFVIVASVCLYFTRPLVKKLMSGKNEKTNVNSLIGTVCVVCDPVGPEYQTGRVKIADVYWSAVSKTEHFAVGEEVKVVDVQGNKLCVDKK